MTQALGFGGAGGTGAFQVSVSTLTLGTLYEAILSFSAKESLETFWPAVCQSARWLIPSRRMCIVLRDGDALDVTAAFERGRAVDDATDATGVGADMVSALGRANTQWLDAPADRFASSSSPLTDWLLAGEPATLFVLPLLSAGHSIGALLFTMGDLEEGDRAMLNTLGTIYAQHVAMSYALIRITQQQREMQHQLVMKEKMASLGHMVAGLLHEMNSPMGAIASAVDVLQRAAERVGDAVAGAESIDALRDDARFQRSLRALRDNGALTGQASERISGLMTNLRSFVRLDEAEFLLADVEEGLDSALALLDAEIGPAVRVRKDYGHPAATYCSPGQLNQAFMNILQNAVRAVDGDGEIRIRTWEEKGDLYVEIEDTGVGIPPEQLHRLFDVSFRSQETRVRMSSGLSVAYHIVDDHDGEIGVDSEVGKGTCVRIRLPVRSQASS